ncbi:MAG: hypothetical protein EOM52_00945, partial [Clostridia bacterium]|nr:hypothetical protein [Clostridia bacterium]
MAENNQGKRIAPDPGKKPAVFAVAILIVLLVAVIYLGLCGYVEVTGRVMPNTAAADVALGGLTRAQAAERLNSTLSIRYANKAVTFSYDSTQGRSARISSDSVAVDADAAAEAAWRRGRENGFLCQGWGFISGLLAGYAVDAPLYFTDEAAMDAVIAEVAARIDRPVEETTYTVTADSLLLHKGEPGRLVDRQWLKARILSAFADGEAHSADLFPHPDEATFFLSPVLTLPAEPDLDTLYRILYTEVKDAQFSAETYEITPHTVGLSFDLAATREQYAHTGWGSVCQVPLILTQPKITREELEAILFRDLLSSSTTNVGGNANRASNVALAASFCNGCILMPGDVFSYNNVVGSRTEERGFLPAPAYIKGETVDEIGGGICQVSSTIYVASLLGNLKILERQNHSFAVGYVPDGLDATIYYGSLDFRFENNTAHPIRMVVTMTNRKLTVQLYGTKTDDIKVKMESVRLTTTPYETIYLIDNTIPPGTASESVTPYTGRKVESYRCLYDGDGKLISRTLESVSNYRKRDRIILINATDAAAYGVDSITGKPLPEPEPTPVPTPEPTPE